MPEQFQHQIEIVETLCCFIPILLKCPDQAWKVVYLCVRDIDFVSFNDVSNGI